MAAEQQEEKVEEQQPKPGKKKLVLIIVGVVVLALLGGGGFFGYRMLFAKDKGHDKGGTKEAKQTKSVLIPVDAFVVNLSDQGRYLKVTLQLELDDIAQQAMVTEKMPKLRDTVITLLSSKSAESVSGPEGKMQLKDELLLRVNQAMGKELFRNLYFTDFVMQ